jgi:hypothetical protein
MAKPRQVHLEALVPRGSGDACRHPTPMSVGGDLRAHRREVRRTSGLLAVCEPRRALTQERPAAPEQIPGRAPGGGRDGGLWEHAATAQDRDRVGIDRVRCRCATRDGLPGEGRPQHAGKPFRSAEVSQPGPGAQAVDRDDHVGPRGGHVPETRLRAGGHGPRPHDLAVLVAEAAAQGPGVPVEATVPLLGLGVESPEVSSSPGAFVPVPADHRGLRGRGPQ